MSFKNVSLGKCCASGLLRGSVSVVGTAPGAPDSHPQGFPCPRLLLLVVLKQSTALPSQRGSRACLRWTFLSFAEVTVELRV